MRDQVTSKIKKKSISTFIGSFLILAFIFFGSILFQNLYYRYVIPNEWNGLFIFKILIFSLLINLFFFIYLFKKFFFNYLRSVKFTVVLFLVLGIALILKSAIPQNQDFQIYHKLYGVFLGDLITLFFLKEIVHNWWFTSFLIVLLFSLIISLLTSRKFSLRELGFFLVHLGMIFILIGTFIISLFGLSGRLNLSLAQKTDKLELVTDGRKNGDYKKFSFKVELADFKLEYYPPNYKLYLYQRNDKTGRYKPIAALSPRARDKFEIPNSELSFRIINFFPDFEARKTMIKKSDEPLNPALKVKIISPEQERIEWLLTKEKNIYADENYEFQVIFVWEWQREYQKKLIFDDQPDTHWLNIQIGKDEKELRVKVGREYKWRNYSFRILKFYPHFYYDILSRRSYSLSDKPENPALLVNVQDLSLKKRRELIWLFSRIQGFESFSLFQGKVKLKYNYTPGQKGVKNYIVVIGDNKQIEFINKSSLSSFPLELGKIYTINQNRIQFLAFFPEAQTKIELTSKSNQLNNPVIIVVVKSSSKEETFLKNIKDEPIILDGGRFILKFEKQKEEIRKIKSLLRFYQPEEKVIAQGVEVHRPFKFKGYKFYQSPIPPTDLTGSTIYVIKQPGVEVIYLGFFILSLGVIYLFSVKIILKKELFPEKE
ncbi:MAG: cytochrome c biogenesis protein ResB [Candidatus Aminicenantia bacterium]